MVNAEIVNQRPRPTNPLLNSVIDGINRQNIQSRFERIVKTLLTDYLNQLEGLTYEMIERIRDGDIELSNEILSSFIMTIEDDEEQNELVSIIGEYLYDIIGDDAENPLNHIDNNIIDDIVITFIQTTQSVILNRRTIYINSSKINILLDYISSIQYWFGNPILLEWSRNELLRRVVENHDANIIDNEDEDEDE